MAPSLDEAARRLEAALGQLEASVNRRLEIDRRRSDLETELQIMQDDRARLAVELESATLRLQQVEAAADDVGRRVRRATGAVREVLAEAEGDERPVRTSAGGA
jgi:chromosome segregation ATPase